MMTNELIEKLKSEIETLNWDMLAIHQKREAIFVIDNGVELLEAGVALASDDVEKIKLWQENESFRKPTKSELELWSKDKTKDLAEFLIIQPYVLIKLLDFI